MDKRIQSPDDFLQGQRDCQEGIKPQSISSDYNRGYACEYEREQMVTELGLNEFRRDYGLNKAI